MAALARPTDENYAEAARFVLLGLVSGEELDSIMSRLDQLHLPNNTFPADVLLELGADAIAESGVTQAEPIEYEGIRDRYLTEYEFRGKRAQHMSHYALMAAAIIGRTAAGSHGRYSGTDYSGFPCCPWWIGEIPLVKQIESR